MNLLNAPIGKKFLINEIGSGSLSSKLYGMGFYPEAEIKVLRKNKSLVKVACGSARIALSTNIAENIKVA